MNVTKLVLNGILFVVVIGLAFWLYNTIQEPIEYKAAFDKRNETTITKLKNIRIAQKAYYEVHGLYADNFDALINTLKNDSLLTVKVIGNPDDSTIVTRYDTIREPVLSVTTFIEPFDVDNMAGIPGSNAEFNIDAEVIDKQKVKIPVYQVTASKNDYLNGLNPKFVKREKDLIMGSLTEGSDAGNWE